MGSRARGRARASRRLGGRERAARAARRTEGEAARGGERHPSVLARRVRALGRVVRDARVDDDVRALHEPLGHDLARAVPHGGRAGLSEGGDFSREPESKRTRGGRGRAAVRRRWPPGSPRAATPTSRRAPLPSRRRSSGARAARDSAGTSSSRVITARSWRERARERRARSDRGTPDDFLNDESRSAGFQAPSLHSRRPPGLSGSAIQARRRHPISPAPARTSPRAHAPSRSPPRGARSHADHVRVGMLPRRLGRGRGGRRLRLARAAIVAPRIVVARSRRSRRRSHPRTRAGAPALPAPVGRASGRGRRPRGPSSPRSRPSSRRSRTSRPRRVLTAEQFERAKDAVIAGANKEEAPEDEGRRRRKPRRGGVGRGADGLGECSRLGADGRRVQDEPRRRPRVRRGALVRLLPRSLRRPDPAARRPPKSPDAPPPPLPAPRPPGDFVPPVIDRGEVKPRSIDEDDAFPITSTAATPGRRDGASPPRA